MYLISNDQIIHESIDGETMIVNLVEGTYYSTVGSGGLVWQMIVNGNSLDDCIQVCQDQYQCDSQEQVAVSVESFISDLIKENLILDINDQPQQELVSSDLVVEVRGEFVAPELHKYSDMQELLLLDPIHDVDDSGWPHPKNA